MGNPGKAKKANKATTISSGSSTEDVVEEPARVKEILKSHLDQALSRQGGDGESLPDTPPNERMGLKKEPSKSSNRTPFQVQFSVDIMAVLLFIVGLSTRLYRLDQPSNVV